jgi:ABC-type cobalamin/Fe3+-siderophores transport system ATPase subunit
MKMDARPPVLGTDALAVEVGRHRVCRDLDFTLQPGHTLVILGRNGAGKSTLLHTLAGLRAPALRSKRAMMRSSSSATSSAMAPAGANARAWLSSRTWALASGAAHCITLPLASMPVGPNRR